MIRYFLIIALLCWSEATYAYNVKELLQLADSHDKALNFSGDMQTTVEAAKLVGYVAGLADMHAWEGDLCIPPGVNYEQMTDVVKKNLRVFADNPQMPGHVVVFTALLGPYNCKKRAPAK
jgi:hypothetical protein